MYKRNYLYRGLAGLIAVTTLVGCGGSSGGGGGGGGAPSIAERTLEPTVRFFPGDGMSPGLGYSSARQLSGAAGAAQSMAGSVTRSSKGNNNAVPTVVVDPGSPDSGRYALGFAPGSSETWSLSSDEESDERLGIEFEREFFVPFTEDASGDEVELLSPVHAVGMVRQIEPTSSIRGEVTMAVIVSDRADGATDYFSLGYWARVILPTDGDPALTDISVGTFAAGTPAGALPSSGSGTYVGLAGGIYETLHEGGDFGLFSGKATLEADFAASTIDGRVDNLFFSSAYGGAEYKLDSPIGIILESTSINAGAFNDGTATSRIGTETLSGEWSGRFFGGPAPGTTGQPPARVGGTFTAVGASYSSLFGTFGATHSPTSP